jgi:hypothetical protein
VRLIALAATVVGCLVWTPAFANEAWSTAELWRVKLAGQALRACYLNASLTFGQAKCDPTTTLVGAVFGKCDEDEQRLRGATSSLPRRPLTDPGRLAEESVRRVREEMTPQIQSWLLDSQMHNPNCH